MPNSNPILARIVVSGCRFRRILLLLRKMPVEGRVGYVSGRKIGCQFTGLGGDAVVKRRRQISWPVSSSLTQRASISRTPTGLEVVHATFQHRQGAYATKKIHSLGVGFVRGFTVLNLADVFSIQMGVKWPIWRKSPPIRGGWNFDCG